MQAQAVVHSYFHLKFANFRLVYEPLEHDDDKLHFDILFNRVILDILNDPDTIDQLSKVDDQYVSLFNQLKDSDQEKSEKIELKDLENYLYNYL